MPGEIEPKRRRRRLESAKSSRWKLTPHPAAREALAAWRARCVRQVQALTKCRPLPKNAAHARPCRMPHRHASTTQHDSSGECSKPGRLNCRTESTESHAALPVAPHTPPLYVEVVAQIEAEHRDCNLADPPASCTFTRVPQLLAVFDPPRHEMLDAERGFVINKVRKIPKPARWSDASSCDLTRSPRSMGRRRLVIDHSAWIAP